MSSKHKEMPLPKDAAIFAGWIAALLLIAGLLWFFTQPVRERFMLNAVNQVLEQSGDPRRLQAPVPHGALHAGVSRMGTWYTMSGQTEGTMAFVFMFIADGTFFPSAAVVAPGGRAVQEFIPLNNHAERMLRQVSPEILRLYSRRITGAEL
ncbi:MAG: hypothetical protein FWB99_00095 [Treponema sp.]|nr:hypothetical protein [Treponema sp.]